MLAYLNWMAGTVTIGSADSIQRDHRARDICIDPPLSVESVASVREAAIAIRYHGVRYLPVVDDGRLVGIVAFREEPVPPRHDRALQSGPPAAGGAGTFGCTGAVRL